MAERDGTIVIDTQIDTKGVDAGSEKTEASLRRMAQKVNDIGATAKAALNKQIDAFARLNSQYDSQSEKIDALKRKIAGYSDEYGEMQAKIDETVKKLNDLEMMQGVIKDAVKDSAKRGTTFDTTQYKWVQEDIEKLTKEIEVAEREQDKLFATGNPFELGSKARAAKEDLEKLSQEEGKLADMHNKLQTAYDGVNDKINEYSQKADEATASTSRLSRIGGMVGKAIGSIATFGKNAAKSLTGAKKSSSGFGLSLGTLVKYGFGIRSLYVLVNKLRSALVDGFKNLSQYSGETNGSISMLWSSLERLKNSLATAFAPILTVVAPILSKFIDMLSTAASYVSMFFSFLSGKSTGINTIVNTLDLFYTGIDWKNLGSKFAEGVNGVVYEVDWAKLGQFIGHKLLALPTVIVGFIENLDWSALSKAASTLVLNFLDTLIEFIHNIDWSKIVTNIQDALTNIQWIAIAEKILELLGYALGSITGALARLIGNLIAQGASEAYQYFEDKIKEAGGNVVDGILLGILDALLGIGSWIVDNVFKPILDGFKNAFGIHSPSTVMQEQGHYIIEGLLLGITDFLSKIKKKFEEIRNLVTEKMDNIKSSAVSKVNEMKKGLSDGVERIKESFRSGFSTLVGYVKSPINSIIRFINNFLYAIQTMQNSFANALNSMSISLPHWLEKLTGFSSVGFNVGYWSAPMVPYLAQGAVIPPNKEFMAVLGDQKSGNNIEAPESLIRRIVREESGNGKGSTYNVTAQVNRRTLFDLVLEEGKVRRTVTGRNPFETV